MLVCGKGGIHRESSGDNGCLGWGLLVWELTGISWKRGRIYSISHDKNMCFSVKVRKRFIVHLEWGENHVLLRCTKIRKDSWVLGELFQAWDTVQGSQQPFLVSSSISWSGIIPTINLSLRWWNWGKDEPGRKRSNEGTKASPPDTEGISWWPLSRMGKIFKASGAVCLGVSHKSLSISLCQIPATNYICILYIMFYFFYFFYF